MRDRKDRPTWRCSVDSSANQPDDWFSESRRTAALLRGASERGSKTIGLQSAPGRDLRRERTEVSRGHTSRLSLEDWDDKRLAEKPRLDIDS